MKVKRGRALVPTKTANHDFEKKKERVDKQRYPCPDKKQAGLVRQRSSLILADTSPSEIDGPQSNRIEADGEDGPKRQPVP